MGAVEAEIGPVPAWITRSGYTGEDGFEISVLADHAVTLAEHLLAEPGVLPAGLGARDSLRLEAGLCLYGADIDELTTPIEANLAWTIGKRRREAADFMGRHRHPGPAPHRTPSPPRRPPPEGRTPARALTQIAAIDGTEAGGVTSGGFSPTLQAPIAMGYVHRDITALGTPLTLIVPDKPLPATVVALPSSPRTTPSRSPAMSETRYTKDHEWVRLEGTTATVGITDHAQQALGDVVFVELPEPAARWPRANPSPSWNPSSRQRRLRAPHRHHHRNQPRHRRRPGQGQRRSRFRRPGSSR